MSESNTDTSKIQWIGEVQRAPYLSRELRVFSRVHKVWSNEAMGRMLLYAGRTITISDAIIIQL